MKEKEFECKVTNDKRSVSIKNDGYGLQLMIMTNGFFSTGCGIDDEILQMLTDVIKEYREYNEGNL